MSDPADLLDTGLAPDMAALLDAVAAETGPLPDTTCLAPAEGRRIAAETNRRWNTDLPEMAGVYEITIPADPALGSAACRLRILVPPKAGPGAVMFVHGGGFAFLAPETHERCARVLAIECGRPVVLPDYRLAPENPWPAGLHDVVAALRALLDAPESIGLLAGPVLVSGDSAGAALALCALLHEGREGRGSAAGALLFYGVYGADFSTPSYRRFFDGPGLTTPKMQRYWDWYVADPAARADPLVAALHASDEALRRLPPLFLLAAGIDPLLSDTLALSDRLRALGRDDTLVVVPGVVHGFLQMTHSLEAARNAARAAADAARRMIAPATDACHPRKARTTGRRP